MFKQIVVGTDGSDTAKEAVRQAAQLARSLGAHLNIVGAFTPVTDARLSRERRDVPDDLQWMINPQEDVDNWLSEAKDTASGDGDLKVDTHAREGDPADAILDLAEEQDVDLIVIGNKGMSGASRFVLGSVPNKISHHSPCSVMIVRTT